MKKIYTFILALLFALPLFAETTTIYLNTGGSGLWGKLDKFAFWYWTKDGNVSTHSDLMILVEGENDIYKFDISIPISNLAGLKFLRLKEGATGYDENNCWDNTGDVYPNGNNCFTITGWSYGSWSTYTKLSLDAPKASFVNEALTIKTKTEGFSSSATTTFKVKQAGSTNYSDCSMPYTPTTLGIYTFSVTTSEGANSKTENVDVEVFSLPEEPIIIKVKKDNDWNNVAIYWFNKYSAIEGDKPVFMTKNGDWYEYEISRYYGDNVNFLFNDSENWYDESVVGNKHHKTVDVKEISQSKSYVIYDPTEKVDDNLQVSEVEISNRKLTFYYNVVGGNYQNLYVWQEKIAPTYGYRIAGDWPGTVCGSEEIYNGISWNKLTLQDEFVENYNNKLAVIINNANGAVSSSSQTDDIDIISYIYDDGWISDDMEVWVYADGTNAIITLRGELRTALYSPNYASAYNEGSNPIDNNNTYTRASYTAYAEAYKNAYTTFAAYASTQDEIDEAKSALEEAYDNLVQITYLEGSIVLNNDAITNFYESYAVNSLTLEAGAVVNVNDNVELTFNELVLNCTTSDEPKVNFYGADIVANKIIINKAIDNSYYYFFSLPFDIAVNDIVITDAEGNYDISCNDNYGRTQDNWVWVIREYSDAIRTTNWENTSAVDCWTDVAYTDTLKANRGYIVGFGYSGTTFVPSRDAISAATVSFKSTEDEIFLLENLSTLDVAAYDLHSESNQESINLHKGYNLISVPSHGVYNNTISFTPTDGISSGDIDFMSISEPNIGGYAYTQVYTGADAYEFTPLTPFFVQVPEAGTLNFEYVANLRSAPSTAPMLSASATTASSEDYIVVNLMQNGAVVDRTTAIFVEEAMATYTNGYDLEKMFSTSIPQVYILDKGYELAVNARQYKESDIITLEIYTPSAGEYTLSLESNNYMIEDINTSEMASSVTFVTDAAGYITGEYRVVRRLISTGNNCAGAVSDNLSIYSQNGSIVVENLFNNVPIYLYTTTGQLVDIYKSEQSNITIGGLKSGVYLLNVEGQSYKLIVNK